MVKQWTINPITHEWERLTPLEWANLKAGFIASASVPEYARQFKIDPVIAIKYYTKTEQDESVALFFIDLYVKMQIHTHSVHRQHQFCLWCRECFHYPHIRSFYGPIYKLRKVIHETHNLISSASSKPKKRRSQ